MATGIENIVGLDSAFEHAKTLKPYSNMGISAALVIEMREVLAAQAKEIEALKAQVQALEDANFELQCFDVDVLRCLKTLAFDHNHADIPLHQKLAKKCMDEITSGNKAGELKAQAVKRVIEPLAEDELNLLICNMDEGDWNSMIYRDCWARGVAEGIREREAINQERLVAKGSE